MTEHYKSPCPLPTPHERELLTILIEECSEVQKRATKALRFGLDECQPGQLYNNAERLGHEIGNVTETVDRLVGIGVVSEGTITYGEVCKRGQLEKYMQTEAPVEFDPDSGVPMLPIPEFCTLYSCVTASAQENWEGGEYNCIGDETRRLVKNGYGSWSCPTCCMSYGAID